MSNTSILITQPNFDKTTQYVSAWSEEVEEFSLKRGNKTITLKGRRSNRTEFESVMRKTIPQLIMLNGHGNDSEVAGQDNEVILDSKSAEDIIRGKIIYALSCSAAKVLGHHCIKKDAVAFIGYSEEYIFLHSHIKISRPREDKRAALFFKPSNQIPMSLIKGNTAQESYKDSNLTKCDFYHDNRFMRNKFVIFIIASFSLLTTAPAVLAASPQYSKGTVNVSKVANIACYNIYYKESAEKRYTHAVRCLPNTSTSYTIQSLKRGVTYRYKVSTIDNSGSEGNWSGEKTLITSPM